MGRGDLSDAEWELIDPLLPSERGRWARSAGDNRLVFSTVCFMCFRYVAPGGTCTSATVSGTPTTCGSVRFRRWAEKGVWDALLQTLVDLGLTDDWHHTLRPCLGSGRKRRAFGRSRGGFTSKVHARCDNQGLPIGFILTGGEASDYAAVDDLMALPLPKPKALQADKSYDGDRIRENLLMRGILPIIPPRSNCKIPVHPDYRRYKDRNRIERMFSKLKKQRRIATRYDKADLLFESFFKIAVAQTWLNSFVNAA